MSSQEQARWRLVREVFNEISEVEPALRATLIELRCGNDSDLRGNIEELLALHDATDLALDNPVVASTDQYRQAAEAAMAAAKSVEPQPRHAKGTLIAGRYRITCFLARGGMGEVYQAVDETESRDVALKFVRHLLVGQSQPVGQSQMETRFLREVQMAQKIDHPNVCHIYDLAEHNGERFCAMELLRGETLSAKLARDGKYTPAEALPIALQLCDGLAAAHHAGVLHRDLKPGNVFLVASRAVIIDFGLAAATVRDTTVTDSSLTATGAVIGTLAYMAPEQLEESGGGPLSDLYSLGVIFYEMLTGAKPHDAKSPFRMASQKARESHQTPSGARVSTLPAVWQEVINRSLKPRPQDRYASAGAMRAALERGRPSIQFIVTQPRVAIPAFVLMACLVAWIGWQWKQRDHTASLQAAQLYQQAYEAMTTAAPMRAVALLEQAIEQDPKFLNARSLLAVAHAETDQIDKAKDTLLQATTAKDSRWMLGRGETLALEAANAVVLRNFSGAAESYGKLSKVAGNQQFALLSQGRMLDQAGKRDEAIGTLKSALALAPQSSSSPAARVRLAGLLIRKRDYDAAKQEFDKAEVFYQQTNNHEGLCDLWIARAMSLRTQTREEDRTDLEQAMALSAKTGNHYQNMMAKLRMVQVAERERDYDGAIALSREVFTDAQKGGMLMIASRATSELGYAYVYQRKFQEALPYLRQSVELAKRAKSHGLFASNSLKLGEVLSSNGKTEEAVEVLEGAVQWYRQAGMDNMLPLILIKWGTALSATTRREEAEPVFLEAYKLAEKNGEPLYQAMAMQRLGNFHASGNLRKSADYFEKAVVFGRETLITLAYFQAAEMRSQLGDIERARQLVDEGEKEVNEKYPKGTDQTNFLNIIRQKRALMLYRQGKCDQAIAEFGKIEPLVVESEKFLRRMRACGSNLSTLRSDFAWFETSLAEAIDKKNDYSAASLTVDVGDLALRLKDWRSAKRYALRGIEASRSKHLRSREMENTLVLRAAEAQLGNGAEAQRLNSEILNLAKEVGFEKPGEFVGRQDLLFFWRLGGRAIQ